MLLLLLMFERVFNRLGHGSVVEKIEEEEGGRRRGDEEEEEEESEKGSGFFILFYFFVCWIRNRVISWVGGMGDVKKVGKIEIEDNGEKKTNKRSYTEGNKG